MYRKGKKVGLFVTAAGIVLFVCVVGRVSALWEHRRSSSMGAGGVGLAGSSTRLTPLCPDALAPG